jgi:hypothetical protein
MFDTSWVGRLVPREVGEPRLETTSIELRTHVRAVVGDGAYNWARELGHELATRALARYDDLARTSHQAAMMTRASESVALVLVESLHRRDLQALSRLEIEPLVRESVYRGVPLLEMERIVREGHPWWSERVVYDCASLVAVGDQLHEVNAATQLLFGLMNGVLDRLRVLYADAVAEHGRSGSARIREAIAQIIADPAGDHATSAGCLRYELSQRHHLGLVMWAETECGLSAEKLVGMARELLKEAGARNTLAVPSGTAEVWAWGNRTSRFSAAELGDFELEGARAAIGQPGFAVEGFATTHAEAQMTRWVLGAAPGLSAPVFAYQDVRLLRLLLRDRELSDRFVREELGALADHGQQLKNLRETLRAYLELRSPQAVAANLFISRSTVSYRLRQIEDLLGDAVTNRPAERLAALVLAAAQPLAPATETSQNPSSGAMEEDLVELPLRAVSG